MQVHLLLVALLVLVVASVTSVNAAHVSSCTWTDPVSQTKYDLSNLTKSTGDYKGTDGTYDYKMNVCARSNAGWGCTDKNYAMCQFSQGSGTFVSSFGSFDVEPTWSLITIPPNPPEPPKNGVQYIFTNGDICWIAGRQQTRTVIIVFRCWTETEQTFTVVEDQTTCTFTVTLRTDKACIGHRTTCTWTDPSSGTSWDLSPLTKSTGDYKGTDGTFDYKMNVCAASNAGSGCTDKNYAMCQFSQAGGTFVASMGSFDVEPTWSVITIPPNPPEPAKNGVQYTFTNGDICWIAGRQQTRTVMIVFRCWTETEQTFSIYEDQTTCTFTVTLHSDVACPGGGGGTAITSCNYTEPTSQLHWDLSALHRPDGAGDYVGFVGSYNYSMNICGRTTTTGPCRDSGHSMCQYNYRGQFVAGLGGFDRTPVGNWQLIDADPTVGIQQIYENGEKCSGSKTRKSIVQFYCDAHGRPEFELTIDPVNCVYTFKFKVPEGCPGR